MPTKLRLFGIPSIQHGQGAAKALPNTKPALLLIYLATHSSWVSRASLASVFQSTGDDSAARHYLRVLVNRAKDLNWADALEVESERLRLCIDNDTHEFQNAIKNQAWSQAFALHTAPFLTGFEIHDAPALETWAELERERHLQSWGMAAIHHAQTLSLAGQHNTAKDTLEQLLNHDPLQEDVVVAYMRQCAATGARQEATRAFEKFRVLLHTELDLEPMPETLALLEQIRQAEHVPANAPSTKTQTISKTLLRPPRLLGREHETQAFQNANTSIRLFLGEPGAGKTRLLEELAPPQACWMRCREGLHGVPYQAIAAWLRQNLSAIPALGAYREDLARLVPETAPGETFGPAEPSNAKSRLLEALARVFEAKQNTIVIDDLQWLDTASLEFFVMLTSRGHTPIVAAARSDEIGTTLEETLNAWRGQNAITEIKLQAMSAQTLQAMLTGASATPNSANLQDLSARSGGNPFFALELLRDATEHNTTEQSIPTQVQHLIERRFKRLSGTTQRVLQAASVLREGFTPNNLADMIGVSEFAALDALEEAHRLGLILEEQFQHDLVRQSVYGLLPEIRRKALHAKAATLLTQTNTDLVVADHWLASGQIEKACSQWLIAAQRFVELGLLNEAVQTLEKTIRHQNDQHVRQQAELLLASALYESDRLEDCLALIENLLSQELEALQRAEALDTKADCFLRHENYEQAIALLQEATGLLDGVDLTAVNPRVRLLRGKLAYLNDENEQALELYTQELSNLKEAKFVVEKVSLLTDIAGIHASLGDFENSLKTALKSLDLSKQIKARSLQMDAATTCAHAYIRLKEYEKAISVAEAALSLGAYASTDSLRSNLVSACMFLGREDDVLKHSAILAVESPEPRFRAASWCRVARIYAKRQNLGLAQDALEKTLPDLPLIHDPSALSAVVTNLLNLGTPAQQAKAATHLEIIRRDQLSDNLREHLEQAEKIWLERQATLPTTETLL